MENQKNVIVGIYKITSHSGKVYIGQSIDIEDRWNKYRRLRCKSQPKLYNSLKKYSWEQHIVEILEECTVEQLDEKETFYKQQFVNEFGWDKALFCHLIDGKGGPKSQETKNKISKSKMGFKHSEESKQKMRKPKSEQTKTKIRKPKPSGFRDKISKLKIGKSLPIGTGEKISKAKKGKPVSESRKEKMRKPFSEEHKRVLRDGIIKVRGKKVIQFDLLGNYIKEWSSASTAERTFTQKQSSNISACANRKQKTSYGYIWKYKEN